MYLLVNNDNSINYAGEHPIDTRLHREGLSLIEFATQSKAEVIADIPVEQAIWDPHTQTVIHAVADRQNTLASETEN